MLEQLFHWSRVWMGILSLWICSHGVSARWFGSVCSQKASRNFLDKASDDTALESKEFADVVAEMFEVFFCQMVASQVHRRERWHFMNRPDLAL